MLYITCKWETNRPWSKDGCERDVVLTLLWRQMSSQNSAQSVIASAFTRDFITGFVYVEAASPLAISRALQGIGEVVRLQGAVQNVLVPLDERIQLLQMDSFITSIKKGSIVQIQRRGVYKHDLALVQDLDTSESSVQVVLVPRIQLERKRKRGRPEACLFNETTAKSVFSAHSVQVRDGYVHFRKSVFQDGLIVLKFSLNDVTDHGFEITPSKVRIFRQCRNPAVVYAVDRVFNKLQTGDRVCVVSGGCKGLAGRLVDISEDGTVQVNSELTSDTVRVLLSEVTRLFRRGDYVEVVGGEHRGDEGFIVTVDASTVGVYVLAGDHEGLAHKAEGREVSFTNH